MLKVKLRARRDTALNVQIEPIGYEYAVGPGDYVVYEWPDGVGSSGRVPEISVVDATTILVEWMTVADRLWASDGRRLPIVD